MKGNIPIMTFTDDFGGMPIMGCTKGVIPVGGCLRGFIPISSALEGMILIGG